MVRKGSGTSHAKIILIGEHSVVYGQPAIALPLSRITCNVTLTEIQEGPNWIDSRYYDGPVDQLPPIMTGVGVLVDRLTSYFHGQTDRWRMRITSMLPAERGMGSSAATAVAIVKAFFDYYRQALDRSQLLMLADVEEQVTHRSPSGLDAATVSSNAPIWFIKGQTNQELAMQVAATLLIVDTGIEGQTKDAINAVKAEFKRDKVGTDKKIRQLGELTRMTKQCLHTGDVVGLGQCLSAAQKQLADLSVSHPALDSLIDLAMINGALGAKLTGGGRGGCFIALMRDEQSAKKVAQKLVNAGASATWIQPLSGGLNE